MCPGLDLPTASRFEPAQPFGCCHLKTVRLPTCLPALLRRSYANAQQAGFATSFNKKHLEKILLKKCHPEIVGTAFVPGTGFEPAQPFGCCHLKTVRLP